MPRLLLAGRALAALGVALAMSGCSTTTGWTTTVGASPYIDGSGKLTTETRTVGAFHAVSAGLGVTVVLSSGSASTVSATADDNVVSRITTQVRDGTLVIGVSGGVRSAHALRVDVTASGIDAVTVSTGARFDSETLSGAALRVAASTGATVRAGGTIESLDLIVDTGSTVDLRNVTAHSATVRVMTGSTAYVNASESVAGSCTMGSTLHLRGGARNDVSASGDSTVKID